MKTVTICLTALFLAALFVVPGAAQLQCNNEVGLFVAPEGTGPPRATMNFLEPIHLYLVLLRPTDCETGYIPLESINAFELAMRFDPIPDQNLMMGLPIYHPQAAVVEGRSDINGGVIDFCCGYGLDVPVTADAVVLVELVFLPAGAPTTEIYLEPLPAASIPGEMSYCTGSPNVGLVMRSVSGSPHMPVFALQEGPVETQSMTFGHMKALYR